MENSVIEVRNGRIVSIASKARLPPAGGRASRGCGWCLVMPGLINGHTHVGMSFSGESLTIFRLTVGYTM